jgi:hypothetical protein
MAGDDGSQRILELVRQDEAVLVQRWVAWRWSRYRDG